MTAQSREYKDKAGMTRVAQEVRFLTDSDEYMVFAYNKDNATFDFKSAEELAGQDAIVRLTVGVDHGYFDKPVLVWTGLRAANG